VSVDSSVPREGQTDMLVVDLGWPGLDPCVLSASLSVLFRVTG